jgi:5-oxoprolinase (ATP-hydrolysing)
MNVKEKKELIYQINCLGSHLPDLTVITPVRFILQTALKDEFIIFRQVFHEDNKDKPVFFVASRGHHADIGGLTPGSMPPNSTSLLQEGAQFVSFKIVEQGQFKEQGEDITKLTKNIVYVVGFSCYRGDRSIE